ncbi:hypothetical protein MRB53_008285 [Persea americana]|uniref:Uncharacterized protein n=1 Tax=Persea americana TaxID=3435 RepID=A0ACC2MLE0_PERAE|nr:hypothetical protein MRB53_008285 [Persea americana]
MSFCVHPRPFNTSNFASHVGFFSEDMARRATESNPDVRLSTNSSTLFTASISAPGFYARMAGLSKAISVTYESGNPYSFKMAMLDCILFFTWPVNLHLHRLKAFIAFSLV